MIKLLVSACLLGELVRYNAELLPTRYPILEDLFLKGLAVPFCPETAAGMPVPRPPAEIQGGSGACVVAGQCRVLNDQAVDVTLPYLEGANQALALTQAEAISIAVLKDGSPSCGSHRIYDGSFSGKRIPGQGVTTALLEQHGVRVYTEDDVVDWDYLGF